MIFYGGKTPKTPPDKAIRSKKEIQQRFRIKKINTRKSAEIIFKQPAPEFLSRALLPGGRTRDPVRRGRHARPLPLGRPESLALGHAPAQPRALHNRVTEGAALHRRADGTGTKIGKRVPVFQLCGRRRALCPPESSNQGRRPIGGGRGAPTQPEFFIVIRNPRLLRAAAVFPRSRTKDTGRPRYRIRWPPRRLRGRVFAQPSTRSCVLIYIDLPVVFQMPRTLAA